MRTTNNLLLPQSMQQAPISKASDAHFQVHHLAGDYGAALYCLLQPGGGGGAAAAFGYVAAALGGGRAAARVPPARAPAFRAAALRAMPRLVSADSAAAARLVLKVKFLVLKSPKSSRAQSWRSTSL